MQRTSRTTPRYSKRSTPALRARQTKRRISRKPYQERASITRKVLYDYESTKKAIGKRFQLMKFAFPVMACAVFGVGLFVALQGAEVNQQVEAQVETLAEQVANPDPNNLPISEEEPTNIGAYTVPTDAPRFLTISKLGKKARIQNMGLKPNSEIDVPQNSFDTGWYNGSAKPGASGTMFISGHVSGPTIPGVFYGLKNTNAGDIIEVERGDGKVFKYSIVDSKTFSKDSVDMGYAFSSPNGGNSLTLITCTGDFISSSIDYTDRLVVRAVQI